MSAANPCSCKLYTYVDGVEYDPFPLYVIYGLTVDDPPTGAFGGPQDGLSGQDCANVTHVDIDMDDYTVGHSGYGSTEVFVDHFSSSGLSNWSVGNTGGITLVESGGVAHMEYNTDLPGNPDFARDFSSPVTDTYFSFKIQCRFPAYDPNICPPRTFISSEQPECRFLYFSNKLLIISRGVKAGGTSPLYGGFQIDTETYDIDLSSSLVTLGCRFHVVCPEDVYHLDV